MTEKTNFSFLEGKLNEKLKTTTGKKLLHGNFRRQNSFEKKGLPYLLERGCSRANSHCIKLTLMLQHWRFLQNILHKVMSFMIKLTMLLHHKTVRL
jgi:hypothetical protein